MSTAEPNSLTKASAINPRLLRGLGNLATGLGTATLYDQIAYDVPKSVGDLDKGRVLNFLFNSALGSAGGHMLRTPATANAGIGLIAAAPVKDLALKGMGTLKKYEDSLETGGKARKLMLATGLPLAALATYGLLRGGKNKTTIKFPEDKGRIKLTLPTRDPSDVETQVDLPLSHANLSNAARWGINRDIRRKLTAETKERTQSRKPKKKDPETNNMIDLDEYREKYATVVVPASCVERLTGLVKFAQTPVAGTRKAGDFYNDLKNTNVKPAWSSNFTPAQKQQYYTDAKKWNNKGMADTAARLKQNDPGVYKSVYQTLQSPTPQAEPQQPTSVNMGSADGSISLRGIHRRGQAAIPVAPRGNTVAQNQAQFSALYQHLQNNPQAKQQFQQEAQRGTMTPQRLAALNQQIVGGQPMTYTTTPPVPSTAPRPGTAAAPVESNPYADLTPDTPEALAAARAPQPQVTPVADSAAAPVADSANPATPSHASDTSSWYTKIPGYRSVVQPNVAFVRGLHSGGIGQGVSDYRRTLRRGLLGEAKTIGGTAVKGALGVVGAVDAGNRMLQAPTRATFSYLRSGADGVNSDFWKQEGSNISNRFGRWYNAPERARDRLKRFAHDKIADRTSDAVKQIITRANPGGSSINALYPQRQPVRFDMSLPAGGVNLQGTGVPLNRFGSRFDSGNFNPFMADSSIQLSPADRARSKEWLDTFFNKRDTPYTKQDLMRMTQA